MSSEERGSALLVLSLALLVPLSWLAFGWRWHLLVGANDLALLVVPALRRLLAVGGDFDSFLYDPAWLGGSKLRDILGALPVHRLLAAWPLDAIGLANLSVFFAQLLYGHLTARGAHGLCCLLRSESDAAAHGGGVSWPAQLTIGLIGAFAPIVAWRIAYGHLFILFGALALPAACTLVLLARAGRLTISCAAICLCALVHALPHVGQQPVLYGAVFGAPLLAGVCFSGGADHRRQQLQALALLALALTAALLSTLPLLLGLWRQFAGADTPRGFRAPGFTYSYIIATGRDWLASLLWTFPNQTGRGTFQLHEANYPLGPVVLGLALLPRSALGVALGIGVSVSLALVFSMNLQPFSTLMLTIVPPLQIFRVPSRAALPLVLAIYPLALGTLAASLPRRLARRDSWLIAPALVACAGPALACELALWLTLASVLLVRLRWPARAPSSLALLGLLALGSGLSFQQRLVPFPARADLLEAPAELGARIREAFPELRSPLVRVVTPPGLLANNVPYLSDLSSVVGYNLLNERLLRLYCALLGVPYSASVSVISANARASYFPKLAALYNIVGQMQFGMLPLTRLPVRGSPLWFSEAFTPRASFEDLVARLDPDQVRRLTPIVSTDRAASALPELSCHSAPQDIPYRTGPGPLILAANLAATRSATCPLTVALNYTADLRVRGRGKRGSWQRLRTYPAYGALLGIIVPAHVRELEVRISAYRPGWSIAAMLLGLFLVAALLVYAGATQRRARQAEPAAPAD